MGLPKDRQKGAEFGDFQTPRALADRVCRLLSGRGLAPASVLEPTCGIGNFLLAALEQFPTARRVLGVEINPDYVARLWAALERSPHPGKVAVIQDSFFHVDWAALLHDLPEPLLVLGNPPWVTNAQLGALGSTNLPKKTNFQNHSGLDAVTGKSNFDISEWMLLKLLELLDGRRATLAMLCKTAVARKTLAHAWRVGRNLTGAEIRRIDAGADFDAAVDACLLVCSLGATGGDRACRVYDHLLDDQPAATIGLHDGQLIADVAAYQRWKHLAGEETYQWRSGIKHDCARVMELRKEGDRYRNALGESVDLEDTYLYPMLKSSEVANGRIGAPGRWMLVPQQAVGAGTGAIRLKAPKTWQYLQHHGAALDRRASAIYRKRPRFSVFGVGDYSFAPWKVAISGFYKHLRFTPVGGFAGKPIVLDDTAYFLPCRTEEEAHLVASLLNTEAAREFYGAFIFWDAKRPITVEVLRRLSLSHLARHLGAEEKLIRLAGPPNRDRFGGQRDLFGGP